MANRSAHTRGVAAGCIVVHEIVLNESTGERSHTRDRGIPLALIGPFSDGLILVENPDAVERNEHARAQFAGLVSLYVARDRSNDPAGKPPVPPQLWTTEPIYEEVTVIESAAEIKQMINRERTIG